ncbi:MAG: filamentous hemagglutinin [Betaproteobacteria bacterium HGW-Betaproteobacteria-16]|nr:MAG: filamentous hemagglutinin [Betaproteobacteria bacterium HGW-Betaproteobacteria-16]
MNRIHRSIWSEQTGTFVAVAENTSSAGKKISSITASLSSPNAGLFGLKALAVSLMMACAATAFAQPTSGVVSSGSATIGGTPGAMVITQTTANVAINWQSFGVQAFESVQFVQPSTSSVALNRVVGPDPSSILGSLSANGKVFLVNPNGILFGAGASVNVGGLVASTLGISDADFMANNYRFSGAGPGEVVNSSNIDVNGGYVALLGANVSNHGIITAQLGTVALAAGNRMTLDMAGDRLLSVTIDEGVAGALVENSSSGEILANGGRVLMTTRAAGSVLSNAVNNSGVIRAQTIVNEEGSIRLLGGMETGTVNVAGTLDASAAAGGDGGLIETSAARVDVASNATVTTLAPSGETGQWLIGSQDFIVENESSANMQATSLSALMVTNSVTISTATDADGEPIRSLPSTDIFAPTAGSGNIEINDAVSWTASASPTTLTLLAGGDTNINAAITANTGNLVVCCGRDVNVNEAITTTNGSVMLGAGRDVNIVRSNTAPLTRITTTDGNIQICAARDVTLNNAHDGAALITLTRGSTTAGEDLANLGVSRGLTLSAGTAGTGPGPDSGTVRFVNGGLAGTYITTTGPDPVTPTNIYYNPTSYETPTDFSLFFTGTGSPLNQYMLVFPDGGDKTFDGRTGTTLSGLKGAPAGVSLVGGFGSGARFETAAVGTDKTISFVGYSLTGANASDYAFAVPCCGASASRTTASITSAFVPGFPRPILTPEVLPPEARPPAFVLHPSAPPSRVVAASVASPVMGNIPLPPVLTPHTSPDFASQGFVFTVSPATPLPYSTLVVQAPVELEELPAVAPAATQLAVPIATPPAPYQPPMRRPKPERN